MFRRMEWDKPVKEAPPSTTQGPTPEPDFPQVVGPQAGKPAWSEDIKAYYQAAAQEPVPPEFLDLMAQIAKQIKGL